MVSFRLDFASKSYHLLAEAKLCCIGFPAPWQHMAPESTGLSSGRAALVSCSCVFSLIQLKGLCKIKQVLQNIWLHPNQGAPCAAVPGIAGWHQDLHWLLVESSPFAVGVMEHLFKGLPALWEIPPKHSWHICPR